MISQQSDRMPRAISGGYCHVIETIQQLDILHLQTHDLPFIIRSSGNNFICTRLFRTNMSNALALWAMATILSAQGLDLNV